MFRLCNAKMLQTLKDSLTNKLPEAMKVYGSIYHINCGNPFNLEVLVDSWPDYQTVITRPQEQDRMNDKDYYTNTYQIFSKDLQKLPEILASESVIDWKQSLTILACQEGFNEKIKDAVASKSVQVDYMKGPLFITDDILNSNTSNTSNLMRLHEAARSENIKFRSINDNFKPSLLGVSYAELLNKNWKFGQNEWSLKYVKRCLQIFPAYCVLDPEGSPISWCMMDQTSELRAGYTLSEYRERGIANQMLTAYMQYLRENDLLFYIRVEEMNKQGSKLAKSAGFHVEGSWHEWKSVPAELV